MLPGFKLKAETINGGTFNGNSFIKAIDIRTNDGNLPIEIKGKSSIDDAGIIIEQKTKDVISGGIISDSRSILNNGLTVGAALDASNGDRRIDYTKDYSQVAASGIITPNVVRKSDRAMPYWNATGSSNLSTSEALIAGGIATSATNFYIGASGEVRVTDANGYNSGKTIGYKPIKASSFIISGDEAFTTDSGYAILRSATDSDAVFLQGSEVRVTAHKSGGTYRPIRASAFTVSSSRDYKKNIEEYTGDALELVNGTRVAQYNLNEEDEDVDYKRIGLIVQESPLEIINFIGGDSIDLYEMTSLLWKSVQELDTKNKVLENEKNSLNERLSKIESLLNLD
ncbi:Phage minor structural protein |nr:Phage minor structural protein \